MHMVMEFQSCELWPWSYDLAFRMLVHDAVSKVSMPLWPNCICGLPVRIDLQGQWIFPVLPEKNPIVIHVICAGVGNVSVSHWFRSTDMAGNLGLSQKISPPIFVYFRCSVRWMMFCQHEDGNHGDRSINDEGRWQQLDGPQVAAASDRQLLGQSVVVIDDE